MSETYLASVFAGNVARLLAAKGWTQTKLAEMMETDRSNISRMLAGKHTPKISTQRTIADLFGVDVEDLFAEASDSFDLPLQATVGAGPAKDDIPEGARIDLTKFLRQADGFVLVRGDSMVEAGVSDGDIVLVKKKPKYETGDVVAAWIQDLQGCVVKQLEVKGKRHFLNPRTGEDETATPIFMKENDRIEGVCLFSVHALGVDLLTGKPRKLR